MSKKKVKAKKKTSVKRKNKTDNMVRETAYGDPTPVRPVSEYYDLKTNEPYPKLIFRQDSWWTRLQRFFGFIP